MNSVLLKRCFNHSGREAAARCMECGRFYCRECVTEHDDRLLCALCIGSLGHSGEAERGRLEGLKSLVCLGAGSVLLFLTFHYTGLGLMWLSSTFQKGAP